MQQQSTIQAGWYHAAGDPTGTIRYWNGAAWTGEPVASSPLQAIAVNPGAAARLGGISTAEHEALVQSARQRQAQIKQAELARRKALAGQLGYMAIRLTFLKALPLALVFYLWVTTPTPIAGLEDIERGWLTADRLLMIAGGLLLFQLVGILAHRPSITLLPAVLMALLDAYILLFVFLVFGIILAGVISFVVFAQLMIAIWAFSETFRQ